MRRPAVVLVVLAVVAGGCSAGNGSVVVGAVYPLSGAQGPGGLDEYRGVQVAVDLVNREGGVGGRPVVLRPVDVRGADGAVPAVDRFHRDGVRFVLGSYGSTISRPAAAEAARLGMLFWETGAVGDMLDVGQGRLVFRVAPTGALLGRVAVDFIADQVAPQLHRTPDSLRFAVANVDDVYGRAVARGAVDQLARRDLTLAGQFSYDLQNPDFPGLVGRLAAVHPDVLFVAAYVDDAVALRRETVRQHVPLLSSIGTSSSYCMPEFGAALGAQAVGLFASDKPDESVLGRQGLSPEARGLLQQGGARYRERFGGEMSAAALAGFSAALALFRWVMPAAGAMTPGDVARAALETRLPLGSLPNGSGLAFAPAGSPDSGSNLRAASVVEQWVGIRRRAVVWPPQLATQGILAIPIAR
jgi:branched-chain amino acid transport system substrate-binding protein